MKAILVSIAFALSMTACAHYGHHSCCNSGGEKKECCGGKECALDKDKKAESAEAGK